MNTAHICKCAAVTYEAVNCAVMTKDGSHHIREADSANGRIDHDRIGKVLTSIINKDLPGARNQLEQGAINSRRQSAGAT